MTASTGGSPWLDPLTASCVADIRAALSDLADAVEGPFEQPEAILRLRQAAEDLTALLLVVVVGEFNAGKSALINALLDGPYLAEGVIPTTAEVQWLVFGEADEAQIAGDVLWRQVPAPRLKELAIIDTPGTNAVLREHERLTREFVPRADLVIFVTSADRPFPESERDLLALIHRWRRRTVVVVNKIDLMRTAEERAAVINYVETNAASVLGDAVPVLAISARRAREAQADGREDLDWSVFDAWLREHLTAREGLRLKLSSPLSLADHIADEAGGDVAARSTVVNADGHMLERIRIDADASARALRTDYAARLDTIDARIQGVRERGEAFLDEQMRLVHLRSLLNRDALRLDFDATVIADAPTQVAADINAHIDWLVEQEEIRWRSMRMRLAETAASSNLQALADEAGPGFASRRQALLSSIGQEAASVLAAFDAGAESQRLEATVREALAHTALLEVGAIGLGVAITVLTAFDATGIIAGSALGALGLAVLPYRRRRAALTLRQRLADLRSDLRARLTETFDAEMATFDTRMDGLLEPYGAFVRSERDRLDSVTGRLVALRVRLERLSAAVAAIG